MMTDEDKPDSKSINPENTPGEADKKGQMLVIYLPEGSVIVDRTDTNLSAAPKEIVGHIARESVQEKPSAQETSPTLQDVVQIAVQAALQITGQIPNQTRRVEDQVPKPKFSRLHHHGKKRKVNWVHGINTMLVVYLLLVAVVPAVLFSGFGMAIYASKAAHPGALIAKGDLMVCMDLPASKLKVNDVLLVRDGNSWHLDARQVTSNTTNGNFSTITTASTGGVAVDKTYVLPNDSGSYRVSRVIPKLGYVPIVLSSLFVKVLGALFVLILNLSVHFRRARKRRLELAIRQFA